MHSGRTLHEQREGATLYEQQEGAIWAAIWIKINIGQKPVVCLVVEPAEEEVYRAAWPAALLLLYAFVTRRRANQLAQIDYQYPYPNAGMRVRNAPPPFC